MPDLETGRHKLPLLAVSQAHKEITHNEALVLIDALMHMAVEDELSDAPTPTDNDIGKCWLINGAPTGSWQDKSGQIAVWIGGGWRFLVPQEGMCAWMKPANRQILFINEQWTSAPAIPDVTGGNVVDVEARLAVNAFLHYFRLIGRLAT